MQTNLIGKIILGYKVEENLGSGTFGTVYKVKKMNVSGQYIRALKHITIPTEEQYNFVLKSMGGDSSKADGYFLQMLNSIISEIQILTDLSESGVQNIVRYYENNVQVTESPRKYDIYILMEYLIPLEGFVQSSRFYVRDVVKMGLDILHGLEVCHNNDVIHSGIKENNIFVSDKGEYKIGNFDTSKVLEISSKIESLKGTTNFLAPEVYLRKESHTKPADLYSLGIVMYHLLNYRSPLFLPHFPEQCFSQDEGRTFEKRKSDKTPGMPLLGGEQIGHVIVKAISNSTERFLTVSEFISALEQAVENTPADILDMQVNVIVDRDSANISAAKEYGATENASLTSSDECASDDGSYSLNRHLFESIGEYSSEISVINYITKNSQSQNGVNQPPNTSGRIDDLIPPSENESDEPVAIDKKMMKRFVFALPVIIFLVGVIVYFIDVPKVDGQVVSLIDWLFTDPQNIISALRDPGIVMPQINDIVSLRVFWRVWVSGLIVSLFFVGRQLQANPEPTASNAILNKKEPYLMMLDASCTLNQLKLYKNSKQLDAVVYAVKVLAEKLSVESDFGYGSNDVISCENSIAKQIQFLTETVSCIENGDLDINLDAVNMAVMNINYLLYRRTELKKR